MLVLAARMKMDDLVPHALGFCPQAANPAQTWRQLTHRTSQRQDPGRNGSSEPVTRRFGWDLG